MDKLTEKWSPILQMTTINKDYWKDVAKYCDNHTNKSDKDGMNFIAVALKTLSKLDLSKVLFTNDKDICKNWTITISVTKEQIMEIKMQTGIDVISHVESAAINELSQSLNKVIDEQGGVVIYDIVSFFGLVENKVKLESWILPYSVYRYKKLNKLTKIINENN